MLSMRKHTQSGLGKQIRLAFNPIAAPQRRSVVCLAYGRLELSRHLGFDPVMAKRVIAIGVRNMADAIALRGDTEKSSMSNPRFDAMSKHADPGTVGRTDIKGEGL